MRKKRWIEQEIPKGGLPRSGPEARRCRLRIMELSEGCPDCEKIRMKPVKAWAVVRDRNLQGQATDDMYVMLVMPTKDEAKKHCVDHIDRVARVEIREVE